MTTDEFQRILKHLRTNHAAMMEAVAGMTRDTNEIQLRDLLAELHEWEEALRVRQEAAGRLVGAVNFPP